MSTTAGFGARHTRFNESAYQLPMPHGAQRWAVAAGKILAEWFTPDELLTDEARERASKVLKKAAFAYIGSQPPWVPGLRDGREAPFQIYDLALEAFDTHSSQQGFNVAQRAESRSAAPKLPTGDAADRMEAVGHDAQFRISDAELLGKSYEVGKGGFLLEPPDRVRVLERAWFVLTGELRTFDVAATERALKASTGEWAVATFKDWEQYRADPLADRLAELVRLGIRAIDGALAVRHAFLTGTEVQLPIGTRVGQRPSPQPYGVSPDGAEHLAAAWMTYLGATGVQVTRVGRDGGIDVCSDKYIAQVKAWAGAVGAPDVRALLGVATVDQRIPLFFATTGYTPEALAFGRRADLALFVMDPVAGTLDPFTPRAVVLRQGLN